MYVHTKISLRCEKNVYRFMDNKIKIIFLLCVHTSGGDIISTTLYIKDLQKLTEKGKKT